MPNLFLKLYAYKNIYSMKQYLIGALIAVAVLIIVQNTIGIDKLKFIKK